MWTALESMTIAARYEILTHIATGGMAAVFRGWDHRLRRPVAIKVLRQLDGAETLAVERFRREAQSAAALRSPYIVDVYDFFEDQGCYYLIMELVEGYNLKELLLQHGPMSAHEALPIAAQVCRALQLAHDNGFIHRDIKPQNVLVEASGLAKLADFGIVHIPRARGFTTGGMVMGTADYVSPEQAQGETLAATTDIYSLGVVLYEMLSGVLPFNGSTPVTVALQHASAPPPPLRTINPAIPRSVEQVVMCALAKAPQQRFSSAQAMIEALQHALAQVEHDEQHIGNTDDEVTLRYSTPDAADWRALAQYLREGARTPSVPSERARDGAAVHTAEYVAAAMPIMAVLPETTAEPRITQVETTVAEQPQPLTALAPADNAADNAPRTAAVPTDAEAWAPWDAHAPLADPIDYDRPRAIHHSRARAQGALLTRLTATTLHRLLITAAIALLLLLGIVALYAAT